MPSAILWAFAARKTPKALLNRGLFNLEKGEKVSAIESVD